MKCQLKLYAPAIMLLVWALFVALGIRQPEVALVAMAGAVALHIHTEVSK